VVQALTVSAYLIYSYEVTDPDAYAAYPPAAMPTLADHDVEILVADYATEALEGSPGTVTIVLRFPTKDAANEWYGSDAYAAVRSLRTENTVGSVVLCDGFVPPA
jgi:uncharacterized protein (DUF1330 family)